MTTLGASNLTLADWAKRLDPTGKTAAIVEMLGQTNEILPDMLWQEGNLPTGHRTTVRATLPTVAWRLLNQGIAPSKSTTAQIDEGCAMLEAWSEVDKDLALLNGNTDSFRLSEAQSFLEAMNQEMADTLFYGNVGTAPEEFNGFATRYAVQAGSVYTENMIDGASATATNSSVWLVCWSPQTVFGIFPKGSPAGLVHENLGLETVETTAGISGNRMRAFRDHFQWKCGLAVRDWRYVVRICNIDIPTLIANSTPADLTNLMIKATHRVPTLNGVRPVCYMNRTCFQQLDIQRRDDVVSGGGLTYSNVDGVITPTFRGIPVRKVDKLVENEAHVA